MLQNDYIMRIIWDLAMMIRKSWGLPELDKEKFTDDIESAVGEAVGIDPKLFFSLEPESAVAMMEMGDVDEDLAAYVTQAMFLEAKILEGEGNVRAAHLRRKQAIAIARRFGTNIPDEAESAEGLVRFFMEDLPGEDENAPVPDEPAENVDTPPRGAAALGLSADALRIDDL